MSRKFFCFARRSEAEAGGNAGRDCHPTGDNQKSMSGFSSKKVRILTKRHRQFSEFGFWAIITFRLSENCHSERWEYYFPSKNFSYATALIDGRYPKQKRVTNLECEEIYFVISGSGIVHSEKGDFEISEGDLYFFEKDEIYWVEGNKLLLALVNTPKWTPEQHKIVD